MRSRRSTSDSIYKSPSVIQPRPALVFRDLTASPHCDLAELAGWEHVTMHMSCTGRWRPLSSPLCERKTVRLLRTQAERQMRKVLGRVRHVDTRTLTVHT